MVYNQCTMVQTGLFKIIALSVHNGLFSYCTMGTVVCNFRSGPTIFPEAKKKWKAFVAELVKQNRATTKHHDEVDHFPFHSNLISILNILLGDQKRNTPLK